MQLLTSTDIAKKACALAGTTYKATPIKVQKPRTKSMLYSFSRKLEVLNSIGLQCELCIPSSTLHDWRKNEENIAAIVRAGYGHRLYLVSVIICDHILIESILYLPVSS